MAISHGNAAKYQSAERVTLTHIIREVRSYTTAHFVFVL